MGQNLSKAGVVGTLAVVGAATFLGGCQTAGSAVNAVTPSRDRLLSQPGVSSSTVTEKITDANDPSKTTEVKTPVVTLDAEGGFVIGSNKVTYVVVTFDGKTNYYAGAVNFNGNVLTAAEGTENRILGESATQFTVRNVLAMDAVQFKTDVQSTLANADFSVVGGVFRAPVNPVINSLNGTQVIVVKLPRTLDLSKPENKAALEKFMTAEPKQAEPVKQDGKKVSMVVPQDVFAYARVRGARA